MSGLADLDLWLFRLGNAGGSAPWLDAVFVWLTSPPHRVVWLCALAAALAVLGGRRGRAAVVLALLAVGLSDGVSSQLLKPAFDRLRPCFALPEASLLLVRQAHSGSFPSSHAANSFAVAVVLFTARPAVGWVALVLAALISYSRVYLGVHYPSDLAGGALVGASISLALIRLRPSLLLRLVLLEDRLRTVVRSRRSPFQPKT